LDNQAGKFNIEAAKDKAAVMARDKAAAGVARTPLMSARQRRRVGGFTIPPEQRKCVSSLAAHVCPPATPRGGFHHPAGAAQVRLVPRRSCLPASDAAWGVSPSRRSSASASRPSPLMSARQRRRTGGFTIPPEQRKCVSSLRLVRHSLCWPCGHTHAVEGSPSSARVSSCGCAARGCVARVCPSNPRLG
jgi:hypothetical protein